MGLRTFVVAWVATLIPVLGMMASWSTPQPRRLHAGLAALQVVPTLVPRPAPPPQRPTPTPTLASISVPEPEPRAPTVVYGGSPEVPMVALTFDDGPSPTLTPRVLEVLREHDAHATFFVLGQQAERHPDALRAVVDSGQELGNHAFSHRSFRSLFPSQIVEELDRTACAIESVGGPRPTLVRPPFGRFPDSTVALATARGEDLVLWTVDGGDSDHADAETIAARVVRSAEPGAIILLHDTEPDTLYALPTILGGLARKGLQVVSVSELLAAM